MEEAVTELANKNGHGMPNFDFFSGSEIED